MNNWVKHYVTIIAVCIFTFMSLVPQSLAISTDNSSSQIVKEIKADDAAFGSLVFAVNRRHRANEKSDWFGNNLSVSKVTTLYYPDSSVEGFLVQLESQKQSSGYLIVSADPNASGVIAYNETGSPVLLDKQEKNDEYTYIPGIGIYPMTLATSNNPTVVHKVNAKDVALSDWKPQEKKINLDNQAKWKKVLSLKPAGSSEPTYPGFGVTPFDPVTWIDDQTLTYSNMIYGVPNILQSRYSWQDSTNNIPQYPGCSPTSGAMVMEYWASKGYSQLYPSDERTLIWDLRSYMNTVQDNSTGNGNTQFWNVGSGMASYAKAKGDSTGADTDYYLYSSMTNQIDNGRPQVICINQPYYRSHSSVAIGYEWFTPRDLVSLPPEGSRWIALHDTITEGTMWLDYGTIYLGSLSFVSASFDPAATPPFNITSPTAGERWYVGDSESINWTCNWNPSPGSTVSIDLYKGGAWQYTIASSVSATIPSYYWDGSPMNQTYGNDYSVRITSNDNKSMYTDSPSFTFTACPYAYMVSSGYSSSPTVLTNTRSFRDNVLAKSQNGKQLISLYYRSSPYLMKALLMDNEFRKSLFNNFLDIQDLLSASVAVSRNEKTQYTVGKGDIERLEKLRHLVLPKLPGEMQGEAEKLWGTLIKEDHTGKPLKDVLMKMDLVNNDIKN